MSEVFLSEIPVEMLERLAIQCDGYAYFSRDSFSNESMPKGIEPPHPDVARLMADVLPRLVTAFEVSNSPRIWRLAGDLCNYMVFHSRMLDPTGIPDWKRLPSTQDHLDLIDCLGAVIRLGVLAQHKPWLDWAMQGIHHRLTTAQNDAGWSHLLPSRSFEEGFYDQGAREGLTFLNAVSCDLSLWDAVAKRYFNPPQLIQSNLAIEPFRARFDREVPAYSVTKQEHERVQINLWIAHQDESITVESGMPEEGWLLIEAPISTQVSVRISDWLTLHTVRINGSSISEVLLKLQPGFIDLPILMDRAERNQWKIEFALPSQTREFRTPPSRYTAVWRGPYLMRLMVPEKSSLIFERPRSTPSAAARAFSRPQDKPTPDVSGVATRKTATTTARLTVVSITEAPLFSTQELLLYLNKCALKAALGQLPNTVSRTAADVERMYGGRWPGMTPCTLPYHDLKHVWTVTAALGDLLCGMRHGDVILDVRHFEYALIAMLLHGTGALLPAANTLRHYELSADFSKTYVSRLGAAFSPKTQELIRTLILCTGYDAQVNLQGQLDDLWQQVAYAMGTAKLLGQMASADYLDRLPDLLDELDITQSKGSMDGNQPQSVQDLPSYFRNFVVKSLDERFGMVYMYYQFLSTDKRNPYLESAEKHLRRVEKAKTKKDPG